MAKEEGNQTIIEELNRESFPIFANIFTLAMVMNRDIYVDIQYCEEIFAAEKDNGKPIADNVLKYLALLAKRMNCNMNWFFTIDESYRKRVVYNLLREYPQQIENGTVSYEIDVDQPDDESDEVTYIKITLSDVANGRDFRSEARKDKPSFFRNLDEALSWQTAPELYSIPCNQVVLEKYDNKAERKTTYIFSYEAEDNIHNKYMYSGSEIYQEESGELADVIELIIREQQKKEKEHADEAEKQDAETPQAVPSAETVIAIVPKEIKKFEKPDKTDDRGKIIRESLTQYVASDTKTIQLLDEFEGIGVENKYVYDRLELLNGVWIRLGDDYITLNLVIKRCKASECVGDITFTEYKKGELANLREYISKEVTPEIVSRFRDKHEIFYFSKPFHLRAQNSSNRTGYGWEWNWSGGIGDYIEGTLYGETTDYGFVGAYIH